MYKSYFVKYFVLLFAILHVLVTFGVYCVTGAWVNDIHTHSQTHTRTHTQHTQHTQHMHRLIYRHGPNVTERDAFLRPQCCPAPRPRPSSTATHTHTHTCTHTQHTQHTTHHYRRGPNVTERDAFLRPQCCPAPRPRPSSTATRRCAVRLRSSLVRRVSLRVTPAMSCRLRGASPQSPAPSCCLCRPHRSGTALPLAVCVSNTSLRQAIMIIVTKARAYRVPLHSWHRRILMNVFLPEWKLHILCAGRYLGSNPWPTALCAILSITRFVYQFIGDYLEHRLCVFHRLLCTNLLY